MRLYLTYGCVDCVRIHLYTSADTFFKRSNAVIAFEALWGYLPLWMVTAIQLLPTKQLKRVRKYTTVAHRVAKTIVDTQTQSYSLGKEGGKDVMSILSKFYKQSIPLCFMNQSMIHTSSQGQFVWKSKNETEWGWSDSTVEVRFISLWGWHKLLNIATRTLMIAGQDSTASTLTWALYELSRNPEFQTKVREEIKTTRAEAALRGGGELTVADLDSMHNVLAVIKVGSQHSFSHQKLNLWLWSIGDTQIPPHRLYIGAWSGSWGCYSTLVSADNEDGWGYNCRACEQRAECDDIHCGI